VAEGTDLEPWEREEGPGYIAPDVIARIADDGEVLVEVVESRRYHLSIGPVHRDLARRLEKGGGGAAEGGVPAAARAVPRPCA